MTNADKNTISTTVAVDACRKKLNEVALQRRTWEVSDDYDRSTKGLHAVLANCLGIYKADYANYPKDVQAAIRKDWSDTLKERNMGVQKNTRPLAMIVKLTFESDRKLASKYASVLQIAAEDMQSPDTFSDWVKKEGGLEEISRSKTANPNTELEKQAKAKKVESVIDQISAAEKSPLATISLNASIDIGKKGLLIAVPVPGAKANIIGFLPDLSESLMQRIYAEISKTLTDLTPKDSPGNSINSNVTTDEKVLRIEDLAKMIKRN